MPRYHYNHYFGQERLSFNDVVLIQAGVMHCEPNDKINPHTHNKLWELTVAIDGEGTLFADDNSEKVGKGDIHLTCPHETHSILPDQNSPLKFLFLAFDTKNEAIESELLRIQQSFKTRSRLVKNDTVVEQIELLINELSVPTQIFHDEFCYALLTQIIVLIVRSYGEKLSTRKKISKNDEFCYQIMSYINTHITEMQSLSKLSEVFNYNYYYISKLFNKTSGQTLAEYYLSRRMDTAKTMLEQGYSCSMVAEALNYSQIYAFSKAFKKHFGISPMEYKRSIAPQKNK